MEVKEIEERERKDELQTNKRLIEIIRASILSCKERCKERIEERNRHILECEENIKRLSGKEE